MGAEETRAGSCAEGQLARRRGERTRDWKASGSRSVGKGREAEEKERRGDCCKKEGKKKTEEVGKGGGRKRRRERRAGVDGPGRCAQQTRMISQGVPK